MLKEKKIGQKIILAVFICCIVFLGPYGSLSVTLLGIRTIKTEK